MAERKITIGTDPEYFLREKESKTLISAIPFLKGDKSTPQILPSGAGLQSDNVAVEFATPPSKTTEEFITNLKTTFTETLKELPKGTELAVLPSASFDPIYLKDPKAREFGCSADYNAWTVTENEPPVLSNPTFRSCGGHIHVGCIDTEGTPIHPKSQFLLEFEGKLDMIKGMDLFHGIISTILDCSDESIARRNLYGKAGCHRPTTYGVEYRTLSNYWTKTPYSSMLMSSLTDVVVDLIIEDKLHTLIEKVGEENIQRIINEGSSEDAKRVLYDVLMPHLNEDSRFYLEECLTKLETAEDLVKEWALEA